LLAEEDLALRIARITLDEKASEITVLGIGKLTVLADYFVIASGRSVIQVRGLAETIEDKIWLEAGVKPTRREGLPEGKWVVLDYGSVIVHLFREEERDFYKLENLWADAVNLTV
jgi:ribosome-associated protein